MAHRKILLALITFGKHKATTSLHFTENNMNEIFFFRKILSNEIISREHDIMGIIQL